MTRDLTEEEQRTMDLLKDAWNCFLNLPRVHREEVDDFRRHLHDLQRIVLARPLTSDPAYPQK